MQMQELIRISALISIRGHESYIKIFGTKKNKHFIPSLLHETWNKKKRYLNFEF